MKIAKQLAAWIMCIGYGVAFVVLTINGIVLIFEPPESHGSFSFLLFPAGAIAFTLIVIALGLTSIVFLWFFVVD